MAAGGCPPVEISTLKVGHLEAGRFEEQVPEASTVKVCQHEGGTFKMAAFKAG